PQQVPGHRFRGTHRQFVSVVAERPLDGDRLQLIADVGGSTVRIYIAHLLRLHLGVCQRVYHHAISAIALRSWLSDVISIGAHAVTNDLPQNSGSAASCKLQFFQDEYPCAFADDEAVAARIPRAAGLLRFIIARGKCSHRGEPADTHRRDGSLGAASNHHLGITARDDLISVAHRVRARGTSGASSLVWSLGAITNADMSGRKVHDCRRNKEGRNSARAPVQQIAVLAFDHIETTDTG